MTSNRLEIGGIISGLAAIGMLHRSGLVCLHHIKFVCDNSAAIITAKITVPQSIFHRLESDYDLISTMKLLPGNWCRDYKITYEWVKGHADRGNEELNKK
jgi:ribonuclease HI